MLCALLIVKGVVWWLVVCHTLSPPYGGMVPYHTILGVLCDRSSVFARVHYEAGV
jgi:hypothetical protein